MRARMWRRQARGQPRSGPFVRPWTARRTPLSHQTYTNYRRGLLVVTQANGVAVLVVLPPTAGRRGRRAHASPTISQNPLSAFGNDASPGKAVMCIAAWTWQSHPAYSLLLLFNRDEYHSRPTRPAEWWTEGGEEGKGILGGRDELGGGTWLGCTKGGKLAFLTNVREPNPRVGAKSRGELPVRFLQGSLGPLEYATEIAKEADQYNGFNLVLVDMRSGTMVYISNKPSGAPVVQIVPSGFHVLSNAAIDSPWPKALRLGQSFSRFLSTHVDAEVPLKEMVQELMMDSVKADKCMVPKTGVDPDWEHQLSSIFIDTERGQARYGTRSMAAVAVKLDGEVSFYERWLASSLWQENLVQFHMEVSR